MLYSGQIQGSGLIWQGFVHLPVYYCIYCNIKKNHLFWVVSEAPHFHKVRMCWELYRCRNRVLFSKSWMFTKGPSSRQVVADWFSQQASSPAKRALLKICPIEVRWEYFQVQMSLKIARDISHCGGTFLLKKREQNCASWRHEILLPCIRQVVWRMGRKCI